MPLSDSENTSILHTLGPMRYADTGEPYLYESYSITLGDPMIYTGVDGRRVVPASEFIPLSSTLPNLELSLEEVKRWLKIEHNLDDEFLTELIPAAKEQAGGFLNRDWAAGAYPYSVRVDVKNIIAYRYEHRGDETSAELPPIPLPGLNRFRLLPGL